MKKSTRDMLAWWLLFLGGVNWGLVGLFKFNIIEAILGPDSLVTRIIYILVGFCAVYIFLNKKK